MTSSNAAVLHGEGWTKTLVSYVAVAALALIGLERMNVIPESGSFVQIYYLLAAPFVVNFIRDWRGTGFSLFYLLLILVMVLSLVSNGLYEPYYWKKVIRVSFVTLATFGLAHHFFFKADPRDLVRGLMLFVVLNIAITGVQLVKYYVYHGPHIELTFDAHRFLNLDAIVIGDYFRPSGFSLDANKGVFNFAYALIILSLVAEQGWKWFKYLYPLTYFSHSRSVLLCMLPAQWHRSRRYAVIAALLYVMVLLFLTPHSVLYDRAGHTLGVGHAPACHLSDVCGSTQVRWGLILLWGEAMEHSTWSQVLFGHGLASAGRYLTGFLDTEYGDFANAYLTIIYDLGLVGLGLFAALIFKLWKAFDPQARMMLLVPLLIFQVFYGNLAEPLVIFGVSYMYLRSRSSQPDKRPPVHEGTTCVS